jgi:hypothetical protein
MTLINVSPIDVVSHSGYSTEQDAQENGGQHRQHQCRCMLAAFGKCPTQRGMERRPVKAMPPIGGAGRSDESQVAQGAG